MFDKKTLNVYSVIIGVLFIVSGVGKLLDTEGFGNLLYQYGFSYLLILSPIIVVIEILLGLMLTLLINPKRYALFAFILLLIFTGAYAYGHFKNGVNDCGCFGTLQHTSIAPIFSFLRNFILMGMALLIWIKYPAEKGIIRQWKKSVIFGVTVLASFIAGLTFKAPEFLRPGVNPPKFNYQNQNVKNTALSQYIQTSPDSTYLLFCFSYTCPHCLNSIENMRKYKGNLVDRIVTLAAGPDSSMFSFTQNFHPDFYIKNLSPNEMGKLTDLFPKAFYIKHDTIKAVIDGELPSYIVFKKQYNLNSSPVKPAQIETEN